MAHNPTALLWIKISLKIDDDTYPLFPICVSNSYSHIFCHIYLDIKDFMMDLFNYFLDQDGNNIIKQIHYFHIYEKHFSRFRHTPLLMFEVGTGQGGSAEMWRRYFGPLSRIVTIDIEDKSHLNSEQIYTRLGSQSDRGFLLSLVDEFGAPDIILDDGSHIMKDVLATFEALYPLLRSGGVYLVEDMNSAYYQEYGGGLRESGSFIERCKTLVDDMNALHTKGELVPTAYGAETLSITFYDMVVVLEKAIYANKSLVSRP